MATTNAKRKTATNPHYAEILDLASKTAAAGATWTELWNVLYGVGGKLGELFTTEEERRAFTQSPEHAEISKLLSDKWQAAPPLPEASGKIHVRLPKSLHASLIDEAAREDTSLNQLIVAKLSSPLAGRR